jgi:hypothetical protein
MAVIMIELDYSKTSFYRFFENNKKYFEIPFTLEYMPIERNSQRTVENNDGFFMKKLYKNYCYLPCDFQ